MANGRPPLPRLFAPAGDAPRPERAPSAVSMLGRACRSSDEGFTLIELLIVVTVMPLVVGDILPSGSSPSSTLNSKREELTDRLQ